MITGIVTDDRQILIELALISADQPPVSLTALVDTGFNGFLTLPRDVLKALGASQVGTRRAELGDGNQVEMNLFLAKVQWLGKEREILALQADSIPLAGMALLWGSRVMFVARSGGPFTIDAPT